MRRVIIGVVGGGRDPIPQDATEDARQLGQLIAARGGIILTGGVGGTPAVKDAAADGAKEGCRISILKSRVGPIVRFATPEHLVVESGMGNARNVLNGFGADAIIALWGGSGTLSEIAFAALAGRRIIFLRSRLEHLKQIQGMRAIAAEAVAVFGDIRYAHENIQRAVLPVLNDAANDAGTVEEAITRVLDAPRTAALPPLHGSLDFAEAYRSAVQQLCSE